MTMMVVLLGAGASPASAQDDVIGGPDLCQDSGCGGWLFFGAIAGTAALTVDSILIGEAIDKGTHGHGLYPGGAAFEIFWGLSHMAAGVAIAAHATQEDLGLVGLGIPIALVGGYFVVHGALSLSSARPPPPPEEEPEETPPEEASEGEAGDESEAGDEESDAPDEAGDEPAAEPIEPAAAVSFAPTLGGVMVQVFGTF
jgi:hypothetical protein